MSVQRRTPPGRPRPDLVMLGARIPRELMNHLKLVAAKRAIDHTPPASIAAITEDALRLWLRQHRYI